MKAYTFEVYNPAQPAQGTFARVHTGGREENRDCLSPSMTYVREFYADSDEDAVAKGKKVSRVFFAKFQGLES
jgi:hypothetical protein